MPFVLCPAPGRPQYGQIVPRPSCARRIKELLRVTSILNNRIEVMHGVNLDQLGRRDPSHYGDLDLPALERQIEAWATELGLERAASSRPTTRATSSSTCTRCAISPTA